MAVRANRGYRVQARHFIESHHVPQANQTNLTPSYVVEQVGDGGLSTGHQDAVRAYLFVDVALAGPTRPKLGKVVIVLDQRNHASQEVP